MNSQNTALRNRAGYVRLTEPEQKELAREFLETGDDAAQRRFGINKYTLARAALGCEIQVGSAAVIRQGLVGR